MYIISSLLLRDKIKIQRISVYLKVGKKMDKSKSNIRIKVIGIIIFSAIVITLTLTFAYLELIPDNSKKTNISGTTADKLKLTYTDCAGTNQEDCANISKNLNVGESVIKTFQIKNESSTNLNYNLYFNQLQNSFKNEELEENINYLVNTIIKAKPLTVKGNYINSIAISSTMGPGIKLDKNSFDK